MKILIIVAALLILSLLGSWIYLQQPKFGPEIDTGVFANRQASPRFVEGRFRNLEPTEVLVGDSRYGKHIATIAERFDGFDLAVLDMGQYDDRWRYIHMTPEEAARAAEELNARVLLPAHVGTFSIAAHAWDEPFERILGASEGKSYRLATPRIGEFLDLSEEPQDFIAWWRNGAPNERDR